MSTHEDIGRVIKLLPGGAGDFVTDTTSPFKALVAGMSAGKTTHAVAASLGVGSANAPAPFLFVEPTWGMIFDVAMPAFESMLEKAGVPGRWTQKTRRLTVGRNPRVDAFDIWMRSGEDPAKIAGFEVGAFCIDEAGLQRPSVFKRCVQRRRHPGAIIKQGMLTGTPEGTANWFYEVCERAPPKGMRLYRAKTTDNPYADLDYVRDMLATLSEQERASYMDGLFVNLASGAVYRSFDEARHHRSAGYRGGTILVGCDFNVDKMAWVLGERTAEGLHIFDELVGLTTNTYRQTDALIERLQEWLPAASIAEIMHRVEVFTDAAGAARKTSANESDIAILRSAGFDVIAAPANPRVRDRVSSVELLLRTDQLTIDAVRCPELANSLRTQAWGIDGLPQKGRGKSDPSAAPDALGYLVWGHPEWRSTMPRGNARGIEVRSYL